MIYILSWLTLTKCCVLTSIFVAPARQKLFQTIQRLFTFLAISFLSVERDTRGYSRKYGWVHAFAHGISIAWEKAGFTIIGEATNAVEALNKIAVLQPDVVVTDISMPGMNGLEHIQECFL